MLPIKETAKCLRDRSWQNESKMVWGALSGFVSCEPPSGLRVESEKLIRKRRLMSPITAGDNSCPRPFDQGFSGPPRRFVMTSWAILSLVATPKNFWFSSTTGIPANLWSSIRLYASPTVGFRSESLIPPRRSKSRSVIERTLPRRIPHRFD